MTGERKNVNRWGLCSHCLYERPVVNGGMKAHRVYIKPEGEIDPVGEMVPCPGSLKPPMPPWRSIDTRNMFRGGENGNGNLG